MPPAATAPQPTNAELLERIELLHQKLADFFLGSSVGGVKPLTAEQLMVRWNIGGDTEADKLRNLQRKCARRGLSRMSGSRGMSATYSLPDVLTAEANA